MGLARLDGRICLITGATSGIGLETAAGLAALGAQVVMVGRDRQRGEQARKAVVERSGNDRVDLLLADLSSLSEVRALAREFLATHPALHVLVNNAGTVELKRTTTIDGFEKTFAVNHLSYFLLTNLLLPRLRASAPSRIVNVASEAHRFGRIDLADLQSERSYQAMRVYGTSKLLNILFTVALAEKLAGSGVTANCLHPGAVSTRLGRNNGAFARIAIGLLRPFFLTPEQGAANSIFVAASDQLDGVSGKYFVKQRAVPPSRRSQRPRFARRVWARSSELAGLLGMSSRTSQKDLSSSRAVTHGIRVEVQARYSPDHSEPHRNHWFFLYTVQIANEGSETVQLLSRHWIITDATGRVEEVRGPGVVGEHPGARARRFLRVHLGLPPADALRLDARQLPVQHPQGRAGRGRDRPLRAAPVGRAPLAIPQGIDHSRLTPLSSSETLHPHKQMEILHEPRSPSRVQGRRPPAGRSRPQGDPPGGARDARPDVAARALPRPAAAGRRQGDGQPAHDGADRPC